MNVLGLCICTREAIRMMREDGGEGVVINVNSLAAERIPFIPGFSIYPASKRTIAALAQTLRHELTGTRIRVTVRTRFQLHRCFDECLVVKVLNRK